MDKGPLSRDPEAFVRLAGGAGSLIWIAENPNLRTSGQMRSEQPARLQGERQLLSPQAIV
jgi:hypothetical protein